jgi:hypothetical protein
MAGFLLNLGKLLIKETHLLNGSGGTDNNNLSLESGFLFLLEDGISHIDME